MVILRCVVVVAAICLFLDDPILAHTRGGEIHGFVSGFIHPFSGLDHVLAMVAVGIWGSQLKRPAVWVLPLAFPLMMSVGGVLGVRGIAIPWVEIGVAGSALVLGAVIALEAQPPLWIALVIVATFGVLHGHAHGTELPKAANPGSYALGFVLATGVLHASGILIGLVDIWPVGSRLLRVLGALIAMTAVYLVFDLGLQR